ncbi:MAG: sulfite reductase (NADPH) flavoprotein alpha-component [Bradymonadia bacterium]|jgi:sulfite reductase (NADPH) flavoprotein alpha-component
MHPIYIIYGTESFNTEELAERAGEELNKLGLPVPVEVVDMDDFDMDLLPQLHTLLVLTSTYGNGDPPTNAEELHGHLMEDADPLPGLRFSVCGLGDSVYTHFAQCGKDFDRRLGELSATRIVDRQDCDVDYEKPFEKWLAKVKTALPALSFSAPKAAAPATPPLSPVAKAAKVAGIATRKNPYLAEVRVNRLLTRAGSSKAVRHVELALPPEVTFSQGDCIGIWPNNDAAEIALILGHCGIDAAAQVTLDGSVLTISDALAQRDLTVLDARLFALAAKAAPTSIFSVMPHDPGLRQTYDAEHHVADLLSESGAKPGAQELVDALRPLAPRQYSIASSRVAHPGSVHLLVGVVRYDLNGRARTGIFSGQISARTAIGSTLPVYVHASPSFNLVDHGADIIMIGPGTGVAPYRGFLQERAAAGASGRAWLFFGDRNKATDFVYQDEWAAWLKDGTLDRLDVAFSRDQPQKVYVQQRIIAEGAELWRWIDKGATIYLCGDAQHMAPDVSQALCAVLMQHGGLSATQAATRLAQLEASGRFQKDVY